MKQQILALERAVEIAGSQRALAELIGAKQTTVSSWFVRKTGASPRFCPKIEAVTAGKVSCADLRPDIFGGSA